MRAYKIKTTREGTKKDHKWILGLGSTGSSTHKSIQKCGSCDACRGKKD